MKLPSVVHEQRRRPSPSVVINNCISASEKYNDSMHMLLNHLRELKQTIVSQRSHIAKQEKLVGKRIRATNSKKATLQQKKRPKDYFFVWKDRTPKMNIHQEEQLPYKLKLPLQFPVNPWKRIDDIKLVESIRKVNREKKVLELALKYIHDVRPNSASEFREHINLLDNLDSSEMEEVDDSFPWDKAASEYNLKRKNGLRTAQECRQRYFNVIRKNNGSWSKEEDLRLRKLAKKYNEHNWEAVAEELGTNRSAFDCLSRYQRSLSTSILKSKWTQEEDIQLRTAVERFGEHNWQEVARFVGGRTGQQCLHRWTKAINPHIEHGKWNLQQDKRLFLAVHAYGEGNWAKISKHIPGRTDVQCRERWHNVLNPDVTQKSWTEEEDKQLEQLVRKYKAGNWSTIARHLEGRTDNQCWRRWKALNHEQALDGYTRRLVKGEKMLPQNFVGREKDRSTLTIEDVEALTTSDEDDIAQTVRDRRNRKKRKRDEFEGASYIQNQYKDKILQDLLRRDPALQNIDSETTDKFLQYIRNKEFDDPTSMTRKHIQLSEACEQKLLAPLTSSIGENPHPIIVLPRKNLHVDREESHLRFIRLLHAISNDGELFTSNTNLQEYNPSVSPLEIEKDPLIQSNLNIHSSTAVLSQSSPIQALAQSHSSPMQSFQKGEQSDSSQIQAILHSSSAQEKSMQDSNLKPVITIPNSFMQKEETLSFLQRMCFLFQSPIRNSMQEIFLHGQIFEE